MTNINWGYGFIIAISNSCASKQSREFSWFVTFRDFCRSALWTSAGRLNYWSSGSIVHLDSSISAVQWSHKARHEAQCGCRPQPLNGGCCFLAKLSSLNPTEEKLCGATTQEQSSYYCSNRHCPHKGGLKHCPDVDQQVIQKRFNNALNIGGWWCAF